MVFPKTRVISRFLGDGYIDPHHSIDFFVEKFGVLNDLLYSQIGGSCSFDSKGVPYQAVAKEYVGKSIIFPYVKGLLARNVAVAWNRTYAGTEIFDSSLNRKPAFNNCRHYKDRLVNLPYAYLIQQFNSSYAGYYQAFLRETDFSSSPQVLSSADFGMYDGASRRGWWEMKPRFEGEVQMLNFLFELKDFKDIAKAMLKFKGLSEIKDRLSHLRNAFYRIPRVMGRATATTADVLRSTKAIAGTSTKAAAELRLAYSFALMPLIRDLGDILFQAGQIVREVQLQFKEQGEELNVRHYSETDVVKDTLVTGINNNYWKATGIHEKRVFTATLEYGYNYTMREQSDAFLRYWGLQLTPEAIWNALPFSFLVDYVFSVGNAIHSMSVDPNVKLMPSQYCESILSKYSCGITAAGDSRANLLINGLTASRGDIICGHTGSFYQRRVCAPNKGMATPRLKLPTTGQGVNMAALAVCFI